MITTPEDAAKLACPMSMNKNAPMKCQGPKCMAWVWDGSVIVQRKGEDVRMPMGRCGMLPSP